MGRAWREVGKNFFYLDSDPIRGKIQRFEPVAEEHCRGGVMPADRADDFGIMAGEFAAMPFQRGFPLSG